MKKILSTQHIIKYPHDSDPKFQCNAGATYRSSFTVFIVSGGEQHNTYNKYFTCDRFLQLNKLEQRQNVKKCLNKHLKKSTHF